MAEAPEPAAVAAAVERRIVSVLFADLVGFTTLSEELDAGRTDLAKLAAQRSAANAEDPAATGLMRASAALMDAWVSGSANSARTAANLASELGAPWWELRALRVLGDPRAAELERALGIS